MCKFHSYYFLFRSGVKEMMNWTLCLCFSLLTLQCGVSGYGKTFKFGSTDFTHALKWILVCSVSQWKCTRIQIQKFEVSLSFLFEEYLLKLLSCISWMKCYMEVLPWYTYFNVLSQSHSWLCMIRERVIQIWYCIVNIERHKFIH